MPDCNQAAPHRCWAPKGRFLRQPAAIMRYPPSHVLQPRSEAKWEIAVNWQSTSTVLDRLAGVL